jgi:hypothetical protein
VLVAAWAAFVYALHAFGRAGAAALVTSRETVGDRAEPPRT